MTSKLFCSLIFKTLLIWSFKTEASFLNNSLVLISLYICFACWDNFFNLVKCCSFSLLVQATITLEVVTKKDVITSDLIRSLYLFFFHKIPFYL